MKISNERKRRLFFFFFGSSKFNKDELTRSILHRLEVQLCLPATGLRACVLALLLAVWVGSQKALRVLSSAAERACCLLCQTLAVSTGGWREKKSLMQAHDHKQQHASFPASPRQLYLVVGLCVGGVEAFYIFPSRPMFLPKRQLVSNCSLPPVAYAKRVF